MGDLQLLQEYLSTFGVRLTLNKCWLPSEILKFPLLKPTAAMKGAQW